nr:MAG TPA: deoxyuridine 5'-triphosphate nucleotidohydrolase [Caudoviricetes sp.]
MIKFERVSRFPDAVLPTRKTAYSAGYDLTVAEDICVPPVVNHIKTLDNQYTTYISTLNLKEVATLTKTLDAKPTLVSTGVKCQLDPGYYLELSPRSSTPLKYWLVMANSVGIIDADYYNNPDNEGEIFLQFINLSPFNIQLHKGDVIGQGIIKKYEVTNDDKAIGERLGGFGSTSK